MPQQPPARRCTATTKTGKPCRAAPLTDSEFCLAHDEKARESARFGGSQPNAGRPPLPKVTDLLRDKVEERADEIMAALFHALDADAGVVVGNGANASLEFAPDHRTRITAARELLDRVYGKPKQQTEHTGPDGGPIQVDGQADLSKLTPDQLAHLRALLADATPDAS